MQIFVDFDGPLLDNRAKYHALHAALLRDVPVQPMPLHDYWARKQHQVSEWEILGEIGVPEALRERYLHARLTQMEAIDWLRRDRLWPFVDDWLARIARTANIFLVTLRRNRTNLLQQIRELAIDQYFQSILSEDNNDGSFHTKVRLIGPLRDRSSGWMIGDTETDIEAGRSCQLHTLGVACGIRTSECLQRAGADYVVSDLSAISPEFLMRFGAAPSRRDLEIQSTIAGKPDPARRPPATVGAPTMLPHWNPSQ